MSKSTRNYGIDVLRILAMLWVIILHILGHGKLLVSADSFTEHSVLWFLDLLAYPAVNCFILISGYVGYRGDKVYPRLTNLVSLFFTVLFYSISITLLLKLIDPSCIDIKSLVKAFLPLTMNQYWFFSTYFAMMLVSPLLNKIVFLASKKLLLLFVLALTVLCCICMINDPFAFNSGYSAIWIVCLYLLGAILKKYDFPNLFTKKFYIILITVSFLLTWLPKAIFPFIPLRLFQITANLLASYTSPTIVLMAIGWVCLFSKLKIQNSLASVIRFFSVSAFSVYLIHDHPQFRIQLIAPLGSYLNNYNIGVLVPCILGCGILIFISCILVDKLRMLLFRLLWIDRLSERIDRFIRKIINKLFQMISQ